MKKFKITATRNRRSSTRFFSTYHYSVEKAAKELYDRMTADGYENITITLLPA